MRPKIWYANTCVSISQGRGGEQKESNSVVFLFLKEKCGGLEPALRPPLPRKKMPPLRVPGWLCGVWTGGSGEVRGKAPPTQAWL